MIFMVGGLPSHLSTRRRRGGGRRRGSLQSTLVLLALALIWILWDRTQPQLATPADSRMEGGFHVLSGARLEENPGNDGDSFRVRHGEEVTVYRLYFVDTCEKSTRFAKRLDYQAEYFAGLSRDEVVALGEEARATTLSWLRDEPFEIHTRNESVMGSERRHAMVRFPEARATDREWLSQRLIAAGLARIYTRGTRLAEGPSEKQFEARLRELEARARENREGARALSRSGRAR